MWILLLGWWAAILGILAIIWRFVDSSVLGIAVIVAIFLGSVGSVVFSYCCPFFLRWNQRRARLREELLAKGVLTPKEVQADLRFAHVVEIDPRTRRRKRRGAHDAFLLLEGTTLHILTAAERLTSDRFTLLSQRSGICSRCWVIWACGGDGFGLHLIFADGAEREFVVQSREGKSLWKCARNTEMLAEILDIEIKAAAGDKTPDGGANKT